MDTNVDSLVQGLKKLPGNRAIKLIVATDDMRLLPVGAPSIWLNPDKRVQLVKSLSGKSYNFLVAGLPVRNAEDVAMLPIYWGKKSDQHIGWIDPSQWQQVARFGVVNGAYDQKVHFIGNAGVWPGAERVSREVLNWETVEIIGETETHWQIGENEWIDKSFIDLV